MSTKRWRKLTSLFEGSLDLSAEDRASFLDAACAGDHELRSEVERLHALDARAGESMEPSDLAGSRARVSEEAARAWLGARMGPWLLERLIASGGMGVVYLARRADQSFDKRVAVKLLHSGPRMDGMLEHFRTERQVLAKLEHPGIAQLHDGGLAPDGSPYLVMEYVDGTPIDRWCDEKRLTIRERLSLFREVCAAVHYAHQNLVVHRDIKPANVLVTVDGQPKLVDFGIAKVLCAAGAADARHSTVTAAGLMTPRYASPEQLRGETITTASDVYSLGVLLFELLCGRHPHATTSTSIGEFERAICEREPTRPSRALEQGRADGTPVEQIARARRVEPPRLRHELTGDLDTIVLKCLAKEPARRYASAEQLSEDLQRHLRRLPVLARPDTWGYRTTRFLGRNRLPVAGAVLALAALLGFGLVSQRLYRRAEFERRLAEQAREAAEFREYVAAVAAADGALRAGTVAEVLRNLARAPAELRGWEWWRLWLAADISDLTLTGHDDEIHGAAWSPDGRRIVSGSNDGTVRLWDALTGEEVRSLGPFTSQVARVAFGPGGRVLAAGDTAGIVRLWDAASGTELAALAAHAQPVAGVAFHPDGAQLASAALDGTLAVWDVSSGVELLRVRAQAGELWSLAFSPDGRCIATGAQDAAIRLWDARTGEELGVLRGHQGTVLSLAFSPDGSELASGSADRSALVWDVSTGSVRLALRGHAQNVHAVGWSPDGTRVVTASTDRTARLWDAASGTLTAKLLGHQLEVCCAAFSPDGASILTASCDGTLKVWSSGAAHALTASSEQWVYDVAFHPDGRRIATALGAAPTGGGGVVIWDAASRTPAVELPVPGLDVKAVAFNPQGTRIAAGSGEGLVRVWETATWTQVQALRHEAMVGCVVFSPDGTRIASTAADGIARLWDAETGAVLLELGGAPPFPTAMAFDPARERLAAACLDGSVRIWNARTGSEEQVLIGHGSGVRCVAFSADGRWLASGSYDSTCLVWDVDGWRQRARLEGHASSVNAVSFSPDGTRLATASSDNTIRLWDVERGLEVTTLHGHAYEVFSLAFSPDGTRLVSGSGDSTALLWESASSVDRHVAQLLSEMPSAADAVAALAADDTLDSDQRGQANRLARERGADPGRLDLEAWSIVRSAGRSEEEYREALWRAEAACRLRPAEARPWATLGAARYRCGQLDGAREALARADNLAGGDPRSTAFLAMVEQAGGRTQEARAWLERLRALVRAGAWRSAGEAHVLLRQAEAVLGGG